MIRRFIILLAAPLLVLTLAGCSEPAGEGVSDDAIIVDVRSAEEYASGHLDGARLLDLNSGEFEAALPDLDPEAEYLVYCRSGSRSAQAIALMEEAGFPNLTNLGSVEEAAETTGIPVVS